MNEDELAIWASDDEPPDWLPIEDRPGWFVDRTTGVLGVEDPRTGAVTEVPVGDPEGTTAWLLHQFEDAAEQAKGWDRKRQALQRAIIRLAPQKRALYGDRVVTVVAGGETTKVDGRKFAERLQDILREAEDAPDWQRFFLLQVIGAGTRWTHGELPVPAREAYDQIAVRTPRAEHIAVTPALKAHLPRVRRV